MIICHHKRSESSLTHPSRPSRTFPCAARGKRAVAGLPVQRLRQRDGLPAPARLHHPQPGGWPPRSGPAGRRRRADLVGSQVEQRPAGRPARVARAPDLVGLCHRGVGATADLGCEFGLAGRGISGNRPARQGPQDSGPGCIDRGDNPSAAQGQGVRIPPRSGPLRRRARVPGRLVSPESRGRRPQRHRLERATGGGGICGAGGGAEGSRESGVGSWGS